MSGPVAPMTDQEVIDGNDYQVPITPVAIEQAIRTVSNRIASSVRECSERYDRFLKADREYDVAYARAYLEYDGPAHAKKYAAEIKTESERAARDVADTSYRYADRLAKALEAQLRAYQSLGASLRQQYAVAGIGEN